MVSFNFFSKYNFLISWYLLFLDIIRDITKLLGLIVNYGENPKSKITAGQSGILHSLIDLIQKSNDNIHKSTCIN